MTKLISTKEEQEIAIKNVLDELQMAEGKFPEWPNDIVYGAAIVGEEAGELLRAALNHFHAHLIDKGDHFAELLTEAEQTAAMAIRMLIYLYRFLPE